MEQGNIEGLLVVAHDLTPAQRQLLDDGGILYVGVQDHPTSDWPSVGLDNVVGGELATGYLLGLGIGWVTAASLMSETDFHFTIIFQPVRYVTRGMPKPSTITASPSTRITSSLDHPAGMEPTTSRWLCWL